MSESTHAFTGPTVVMQTDRLMEHMQSAIDDMVSKVPSAEVVRLDKFNANSASWLGSRTTDHAGSAVFDLAMNNGLS